MLYISIKALTVDEIIAVKFLQKLFATLQMAVNCFQQLKHELSGVLYTHAVRWNEAN